MLVPSVAGTAANRCGLGVRPNQLPSKVGRAGGWAMRSR